MLGTFQCPFSFDGNDTSMAKATHTISSTLDDLQLNITLWIHEQISEFLSLWHYPPSLRNRRDARTHSVERRRRGSGSEAGQEVGRELPSPSLFKEEGLSG